MANELFDELSEEVKTAEEEIHVAETAEAENKADTDADKEEAAEKEETEGEKKEVPRIPLPELQAERKRRQAAEAEAAAEREKYARLDERLKILDERMKPPEIPDFNEDPFEHLRQREDRTVQTVEELRKQMEDFGKQTEAQRFQEELTHRVISAENAFRQEHPDYDDAVKHLKQGRAQEYMAMGINDPAQIERMLGQEALQLAQTAMQNNMSPAEMAYNISKSRGYRSENKDKKPVDKLDNVQKGQEKSSSLSNAGGGEERVLDIEALANMDDEDFAKAVDGGQWEKLLRSS